MKTESIKQPLVPVPVPAPHYRRDVIGFFGDRMFEDLSMVANVPLRQ